MSRRFLSNVATFATPAALVAAAPSAWRLASHGTSIAAAEIAVAAVLVVPFALVLVPIAPPSERWAARTAAIAGARGVALLVQLLTIFAGCFVAAKVLVVHTHHRGLGGVTFAAAALGVGFVATLVAWRVGRYVAARANGSTRVFSWVTRINRFAWLCVGLFVLFAAVALLVVARQPGGSAADASFALLVVAVAAGFRLVSRAPVSPSTAETPSEKPAAPRAEASSVPTAAAPLVALGLLVAAGATYLCSVEGLRAAIAADAPLAAGLLESCGLGPPPAPPEAAPPR